MVGCIEVVVVGVGDIVGCIGAVVVVVDGCSVLD